MRTVARGQIVHNKFAHNKFGRSSAIRTVCEAMRGNAEAAGRLQPWGSPTPP